MLGIQLLFFLIWTPVILLFVKRNTCLIYIPFSGTELQKPLEFPERPTLGNHQGVGPGCQGNQPCDQRVGPFGSTPNLQGAEGLEVESVTHGQWFNQSYLSNEALKRTGRGELPVGEPGCFHMPPSPRTEAPLFGTSPFLWLLMGRYPFVNLVSYLPSWSLWPAPAQLTEPKERVEGTPDLYSQPVRSPGNSWTWDRHLE